ncbi:MAG: ABC transporter substrate-binding protein [Acidimicrobiales bacterium]
MGGLAERWTVSDDRLTWTFELADGVVDGDGVAVQAEDVKRSLERVAARGRRIWSPGRWPRCRVGRQPCPVRADEVSGIQAGDDGSVVIMLAEPFELP